MCFVIRLLNRKKSVAFFILILHGKLQIISINQNEKKMWKTILDRISDKQFLDKLTDKQTERQFKKNIVPQFHRYRNQISCCI